MRYTNGPMAFGTPAPPICTVGGPRPNATMSNPARSVGTGALRSSSGSNSSSSSPPRACPVVAPADPFGFATDDGPYGLSSRAMKDVSKLALTTSSVGRKPPTRPKVADEGWIWGPRDQRQGQGNKQAQSTPGPRPHLPRHGTNTDPPSRWRVDGRGWVVDVKQGSSPKVLRSTGMALAAADTGRAAFGSGARAASANCVPRRVNWTEAAEVERMCPQDEAWLPYESPKVARGRVLGSARQDDISLATIAGPTAVAETSRAAERGLDSRQQFPIRDPTTAQVEAFRHYEQKARRLSTHEYANGRGPPPPPPPPLHIDCEGSVADAGWEAKRTRQMGQMSRLYDELYEVYSSSRPTGCGAEMDDEAVMLEHPSRNRDGAREVAPTVPFQVPPTAPASEQQALPGRPTLLIQRKPVGSPTALSPSCFMPSQAPSSAPTGPARSTSSPAVNCSNAPTRPGLLATQLRSASSSPPKKQVIRSAQRRPHLTNDSRGISLPCAFPVALHVDEEDDVDEPWPPTPTPAGGTVKRREKAEMLKWKALESVPLPFPSSPFDTSTVKSKCEPRKFSRNEHEDGADISLEGPELLYSPSPFVPRPPTVVWELHPRVKSALAEAAARRGSVLWAVKAVLLCWVAACVWGVLDAVAGALVKMGWPVWAIWDVGRRFICG